MSTISRNPLEAQVCEVHTRTAVRITHAKQNARFEKVLHVTFDNSQVKPSLKYLPVLVEQVHWTQVAEIKLHENAVDELTRTCKSQVYTCQATDTQAQIKLHEYHSQLTGTCKSPKYMQN